MYLNYVNNNNSYVNSLSGKIYTLGNNNIQQQIITYLQIDPYNLPTVYLQDNNAGINNNFTQIYDHLGSLDHHIHVLEDAVGITNGIWGFTTILNGILQVTTYASVQSQLTSHQGQIDGLQAEINEIKTEITGDESAISRLENLTQNIDLTKTVTGTTTFNNNIVLNSGEFYIQYNRIDPITLLTSPSIVC